MYPFRSLFGATIADHQARSLPNCENPKPKSQTCSSQRDRLDSNSSAHSVGMLGVVRRAIIIGNGFAGAENQCLGLVRALGLYDRYSLYRVTRPRGGTNESLHWLPVSLHRRLENLRKKLSVPWFSIRAKGKNVMHLPAENMGLSYDLEADAKQIARNARETFEKHGPLLVVASGRDTIRVSSAIKRLAPEQVFVIQIQHPRSRLDRFDLVITPSHDYYPSTPEGQKHVPWFLRRWITPRQPPGRNVVLTLGALHQVDSTSLQSAMLNWHYKLASLQKPLLVVNIGGPISHCRYSADLAKQLTTSLHSVLPSCGSVRLSFSRRTPPEVSEVLVREFCDHPKVFIWDGKDPNPHMGHLAWADAIVITADSVSMLSEACSTGKPVYVIGAERCTWKFADFQRSLEKRGMVRPFTGKENISEKWSYSPLRDTEEAAERVREALAERGWTLMH